MFHDWHQFHHDEATRPATVDSRRRLRICLATFLLLLLIVFARTVQLEMSHGAAYRAGAVQPLLREESLPGVRGRILARDGTVLAGNRDVLAVAVHYRYLQEPADHAWLRRMTLRQMASQQLSQEERKDPAKVEVAQAEVLRQRADLAGRLAKLCELSDQQWNRRARRVQSRVERIHDSVNRSRRSPAEQPRKDPPTTLSGRIGRLVSEMLAPPDDIRSPEHVVVVEELDYHTMAEDVPLAVVATIEGDPDEFPGVTVTKHSRRVYPAARMAAHVLGHVGRVGPAELQSSPRDADPYHPEDTVGRMGIERQYETLLRGRRGEAVRQTDRSGQILSTEHRRKPGRGRDLILTLHPQLQRAAETLLAEALQRRSLGPEESEPAGGAIVVMDVNDGALWAAASAPAFDPNLFVAGDSAELAALLNDPSHPLFDRVSRMAIPPGSVFKTITAVALLEESAVAADAEFYCQGYLHQPDQQRCAIFRRHGIGHDEVTLTDALAQSCNVYFFHHAGELGVEPLIDWARRFGLARPTGVDLPNEASGTLPTPATIRQLEGHAWRPGDTCSLAIGQGSMTVTPLQMVRVMGAVANGGQLVTPHLVSRLGLPESDKAQQPAETAPSAVRFPRPKPVAGLQQATLAIIRAGLVRVVADPDGTAHGGLSLDGVSVAGKTGTAETGGGRAAHAWFGGYFPVEKPRFAFVVVLEHSGDAAASAVPVARRLVQYAGRLGL